MNAFHKVLWALDPLVKEGGTQLAAASALNAFAKSSSEAIPTTIQPVAVILEEQIPYLTGKGYLLSDFRTQLETSLSHWLNQVTSQHCKYLSAKRLLKPVLLIEKSFSVKASVLKLLDYATTNLFDVVVANTHAKKRNGFVELGSFSETLFLTSPLPLFLVNPSHEIGPLWHEIFFPTDQSEASLQALPGVASLAQRLKASVTLFHKITPAIRDAVEFPNSREARIEFLTHLEKRHRREIEREIQQLSQQGIPSELILDSSPTEWISQAIAASAQSRNRKNNGTFIAMVSQTHALDLGLPGSITRQVLRSSSVPVWILPQRSSLIAPYSNKNKKG